MSYRILNTCCGCHICYRRCPVGAVNGAVKEVHTIDEDLCVDCGLCAKSCAMGCILDPRGKETEKIDKRLWKKPEIERDVCVGCSLCVVNCPAKALEIEEPKFHGDIRTIAELARPEDCIDCRICESVCPVSAINFK